MADFSHILDLIREYFLLEDDALIHNHAEHLKLIDIGDSLKSHPHKNFRVYITRRALKHVVERRKNDLLKRHTREQSLVMIVFAIEAIPEIIKNFDSYKLEQPSNNHFYSKDFSNVGMPSLKILLEKGDGDSLYIKSVHFSKRTKKHH